MKYKSLRIRKLEKKLNREKRKFSRKWENYKKRKLQEREETVTRQNILKQQVVLQKLYLKLSNARNDYIHKVTNEIVRTKPSYIVIEDLNILGLLKNKNLSKSIQNQKLYKFKRQLIYKCKKYNIELRMVNRFYPSSKLCSCCGHKKDDLSLSGRIYECTNCGVTLDRDINASVNLEQAIEYTLLT